ncbi:molybdopterin biosynthesis-like protein MoeZ [Kocuria rosea subsp. polaris]|uniref:Molybdopterin biosynthesis-like protein MoeZ n=1 Tax=Kocuria rosea subsp. polaris TaxID=136273 RepID=A0A0W8I2W3_KOCRO|nr:molybdopterin-synthase adenylyltransferase MoeB [Kocuria polaris]KUG52083.1 molybdopterin biosynthesis-like protein MoeZ [Kocuria polaris]
MDLPPLVEPAPELTDAELRRYARHLTVPEIGEQGQRRLKNARVLCVGAGGLGSPALLYLAAAGVGTLGVVDDDVVEASNLQRQVVHGGSTLGAAKTASAAARIADLNPLVHVVEHRERLTAANAEEVLAGYDLVLDGTDNFGTRYLVSDACELTGLPHVWGSILRFDGQYSVFWGAHGPTYRDLYPVPPAPGTVPSCAEAGVLGVLPGLLGTAMAVEAVKLVTGIGTTMLGRVATYDALSARWWEIPLAPTPGRAPVTSLAPGTAGTGADGGAPACPAPAPEHVPTVTAPELAALLAARERGAADFELVDVREPYEARLAAIPGSRLVPLGQFESGEALARIAPDRRVLLHCKAGARSERALRLLVASGHRDVAHLEGGVLAWIEQVDPSQQPY